MFDDVVQDVKAHVEGVVSAKIGELEERLSKLLSGCAKETCAKDASDMLKMLLAGIETRFQEQRMELVEAINEQKATINAQMTLLEALCVDVKTMNGKADILCSHDVILGTSRGTLQRLSA